MLMFMFFRLFGPNGGGMEPHDDDFLVFWPHPDNNSHTIVHEIVCPRHGEECFKVEDYPARYDQQGAIVYARRLMVEEFDEVVLTVVELLKNGDAQTFTPENARRWPVQKARLLIDYVKAVIGQMFATGCIQLQSRQTQRTLMFGLGGAAIPNFLGALDGNHEVVSVELEPAIVYIAHKWFGLEKTERQKVVVQEGIEFINQWHPSSGQLFDCIIIDACRAAKPEKDDKHKGNINNSNYPLICPQQTFVDNEAVIKKLFSMLRSDKGTLLINTFTLVTNENREKVAEERQFLLELFRHHFGYCYYAGIYSNKLLVCSRALSKSQPMSDALYRKRMRDLPQWLRQQLQMPDGALTIEEAVWQMPRTEV